MPATGLPVTSAVCAGAHAQTSPPSVLAYVRDVATLKTMKGYGSFCPVEKAAEILAKRWTLLILRDILVGSRHFNDLRRSIPLMSPVLLFLADR